MTPPFPTRRSSDIRDRPDGAGPEAIERINARIQAQLVATGEIALSPTTLDGRYSLRVCIVNFRTRRADIDWLVERVLAFGREAGGTGCTTRRRPRRQAAARHAARIPHRNTPFPLLAHVRPAVDWAFCRRSEKSPL